jgi:CO/xanthine dehydrogenase Mo-binding subunit
VAEELEIAPSALGVELAGAHAAFANSALGMQITGGSTSVVSSFVPLRTAAAVAREMLRAAAAKTWGVPLDQCKAENGEIVHVPTNRRLRYGALAKTAASMDVETPKLKEPKDWKYIGKPVTRRDARMKVDGSAIYGIDVTLPNLRTAVILRAPGVGAKLLGFKAEEALKDPGVEAVFAVPSGVAVVAQSYWRARKAADKVTVTWSATDPGVDSQLLGAAYRERVGRDAAVIHAYGDHGEAEKQAGKTLEAIYELPYLAHATMEPQNATAWIHDGKCDIWAPTQSPALAAEVARRITGISMSNISIKQTLLGGGFGRRLQQDYVEDAVYVAMRVSHPVKVVWSREDDMKNDGYRPMATSSLKGTVDKAGKISSWSHRLATQSIVAQSGSWIAAFAPQSMPIVAKMEMGALGSALTGLAARGGITDPTSIEGAGELPYELPAFKLELAPIEPQVTIGSWRSVGVSHTIFVVESFMDELAHAGGQDPFEARRKLLRKGSRELAVLELAAQKAGWGTPASAGVFRGIAVAKAFNSYCAEVAEVSVDPIRGLKVHRVVAAIDCGTVVNPDIVRMQVESSIAYGLSAAMHQQITFRKGVVEQVNFHDFPPLRMNEMPHVEVHIVESKEPPTGVGEPGLPPIAPAVANAIFAATGKRIRKLPFAVSAKELFR